jgi:hypothetical protein
MSYFITICHDKDVSPITILPDSLKLIRQENQTILALLPANYITNCIVSGFSSCNLLQFDSEDNSNILKEKMIEKYKKKGWSEKKIEKAMKDSSRKPNDKVFYAGVSAELYSFLLGMIKIDRNFKLLIHHYSGYIDAEKIELKKAEKFCITKLEPDKKLKENILYSFY